MAVAGCQWALEGPFGAGHLNRTGAPRMDSVTPAATRSVAPPLRGGGMAGGAAGGRGVKPVSAAALRVGRHSGATARMAPVARESSLSGRAGLGGGELEVSGVWACGRTFGRAGLAVGGAGFGLSGSAAGVDCGAAGARLGPGGQRRAFSSLALGQSAAFGVGGVGGESPFIATRLAAALWGAGVAGGELCGPATLQRGQLSGGQLASDRLDTRLCQAAGPLCASWPKQGGVCLCDGT